MVLKIVGFYPEDLVQSKLVGLVLILIMSMQMTNSCQSIYIYYDSKLLATL